MIRAVHGLNSVSTSMTNFLTQIWHKATHSPRFVGDWEPGYKREMETVRLPWWLGP